MCGIDPALAVIGTLHFEGHIVSQYLIAVRVWDLPTRLFHWTLALLVVMAFVLGSIGGDAMAWHFRCGYGLLALLIFRLLWGLWGGYWSRFSTFIYTPGTLIRYLRGQTDGTPHLEAGHSPTGALAVFAMLGILALQVVTGLLCDDDIAYAGPLAGQVSHATSTMATTWHTTWGQWLILGLVGLHLSAIAFYVVVRQRTLLAPMVHGNKQLPPEVRASLDGKRQRGWAIALLLVSVTTVAIILMASG